MLAMLYFDVVPNMIQILEVFIMAITAEFLQSLVPISQFNKGQAAKILDRLHSERDG